MGKKEATRRSGNSERANDVRWKDGDIIARNWERGCRHAGIILGLAFGGMFAVGIWIGW